MNTVFVGNLLVDAAVNAHLELDGMDDLVQERVLVVAEGTARNDGDNVRVVIALPVVVGI